MSPLAQLKALFAASDEIPLQIRLFRLICAAAGFLCLAVILPINVLLSLPVAVKVAALGLGLFAVYCFYASRRDRHYSTLFLSVVIGVLNLVWFLNAGSQGSINQYFVVLGLYPIAIFRGRRRWISTGLLGLNFCGLQLVEHFVPGLVVPYQGPIDRLLDQLSGAFDSFLLLVVVAWLIMEAHDREQRRLAESVQQLAASEKKLRESKEHLAEVLHVAAEGIAVQTPAGVVVQCNQAVEQILGLDRDQVLGRRPVDFIRHYTHPDGRPFLPEELPLTVAVRTGQAQHEVEMVISTPGDDRPTTHLLVNNEPILDETGAVRMVVTSFNDITGRKQAEADRLVLSKLESTGVMAGGIAHDFNNLLTAILLNIELAEFVPGSRPETGSRLKEARQAVAVAKNLTQQLITFSQGGDPMRQWTDVERLLRDSVRVSLSGSAITDQITVAPDLWAAELDGGQVGQVFRNLLLNAREAMPQGGRVVIRLENLAVGVSGGPGVPPGDYLKISIADSGRGIPPEVLPRIFDPYFSTKERGVQKGMGLGLTICHSVTQKHGGAITVDSVPGQGTTACVYLPAARVRPPESETPAPSPATEARRAKILVMDDEETVRNVVGLVARQLGHGVTLAADGREAVEQYRQARTGGEPFDLAILDLSVRNGMGGLETIQALRAMDPAARAVVMSGYANEDAVQNHERYGFKGAIKKPFDIAALRVTIGRALSG